ncbi:MAG: type III secretion system export apparatus subunit SctR, partial [Gammaproteobacteria bacterium]
MVLHGLALILTMYIMAPVGIDSYENISSQKVALDDLESLHAAFDRGMGPYREFLLKHSDERQREFFKDTARQLWADEHHQNITDENIIILLPAFMLGELVIAFEIGFLIYMPFVVIDLIISNILMAMGMMMMSPTTISLPFKLLLFVFLDGWVRLIQGLILSYQ